MSPSPGPLDVLLKPLQFALANLTAVRGLRSNLSAAISRERVEQFEAQAAKARAAGDTRRAERAEAQAAQWREWLAAAEKAVATR